MRGMQVILKPVMIDYRHQPEIEHLHDVQARFTGIQPDRINLLRPPVRVAIGFEDERGKVRGGYYVENVAEFCMIGNSPEATERAIEVAPVQLELLRRMGYNRVRCFIPQSLKLELGPKMVAAGLHSLDADFSHYTIDLRGGNNVKG